MIDEDETRMERVKRILVKGVGSENLCGNGSEDEDGNGNGNGGGRMRKRSIEGRAVAFANRIGELALGMMKLPAFRERQDVVFKVLAGIGG